MQRDYKCVLPILLTRSWGLKSTFIITGAFKEAITTITEIENYWHYDDTRLSLSIDLRSMCMMCVDLFSFTSLFLPLNTFYPLSLVSQPTKTQWPTREKTKFKDYSQTGNFITKIAASQQSVKFSSVLRDNL